MSKHRLTAAERQHERETNRSNAPSSDRSLPNGKSSAEHSRAGSAVLSTGEQGVLDAFRKYLMTPGKMLCFSRPDRESMKLPLHQLIVKGLLIADVYEGGYSLTLDGFTAMNDHEPRRG